MQYRTTARRYASAFLCFVVVFFLLTGCGGGGDEQTVAVEPKGEVSGTVTDYVTGWPLPGVTVTINGQSTVSDAQGLYGFGRTIAVGTWDLTAELAGYETYSVSVSVTGGVGLLVDPVMTPFNNPPVADAGVDRILPADTNVVLDGSGSVDADDDTLIYSWKLIDFPIGSQAEIVDPASFRADLAGIYIVELSVDDGLVVDTDQVQITVVNDSGINSPPEANAGGDLAEIPGAMVVLDGTGSTDPDDDALFYQWSLFDKPSGSGAILVEADTESPRFVADLAGIYQLRLIVFDGTVNNLTDETVSVTVAVVNYNQDFNLSLNQIPAGSFFMGSPAGEVGRDGDEVPFKVTLSQDYYMMTAEVTQGQWQAVMGGNPSFFQSCGADCPVENVTWAQVQDFITELNNQTGKAYRLPTEAEWEYAARAGTLTATYAGDLASSGGRCEDDSILNGLAWYCANEGLKSHLVGEKNANPWGLYDMLGNVWEWTDDWHGVYPVAPEIDPAGPVSGTYKVCRGGAWGSVPALVRAASRFDLLPVKHFSDIGFRLVLPVN